jgi:hypothetical protein
LHHAFGPKIREPKEVAKFTIIFELYADGKTLRGVLLREGEESWEVTDICEAENNIHGVVSVLAEAMEKHLDPCSANSPLASLTLTEILT